MRIAHRTQSEFTSQSRQPLSLPVPHIRRGAREPFQRAVRRRALGGHRHGRAVQLPEGCSPRDVRDARPLLRSHQRPLRAHPSARYGQAGTSALCVALRCPSLPPQRHRKTLLLSAASRVPLDSTGLSIRLARRWKSSRTFRANRSATRAPQPMATTSARRSRVSATIARRAGGCCTRPAARASCTSRW